MATSIQSVIKRSKGNPEDLDLAMSLAHLPDTETYEISHILSHANTKVTNLGHAKRQLEHIKGHAKGAAEANKLLIKKLKKLPEVKAELSDIKQQRGKAE